MKPLVIFAILAGLGIGAVPAHADLAQWLTAVNAGSPTYEATQISPLPTTINIGSLSGNNTYEFIVNGQIGPSTSGALMADGSQAIKFDQYPNTGLYGATQYGIADYDFGEPTTVGNNVVLDFVANSGTGTTSLFVNGAAEGTAVPFALTLSGNVTVGAAFGAVGNQGFFDDFNGQILGLATFDSGLSGNQIMQHANAFFAVPEPSSLAMFMSLGVSGLWMVRRLPRRRK
ncbi:MAG TPA: PEP-CTERM sorting domain-containing protein [Pseudomonadales bacterium]|nr:PEP-CTERM sorting domain-containing protein [Pseudomonadales bacterium]